jgi:GNAT superfamily N-acetyltransferase
MASDNALLTASPDALEAWLAALRARGNMLDPGVEALPGVTSGAPRYAPPVAWSAPPTPVNPMWPTSNAVGTERLVNYAGYDAPSTNLGWMTLHRANQTPATARDAAIDAAVQNALAPAANTTYGDVLPMARDNATGELRIALPAGLRSLAQGAWDVSQGPRTGGVTPEGTLALASLVNPLERPVADVLNAFGGSKRDARLAATEARAVQRTALDEAIDRTMGVVRPADAVPLTEVVAKTAAAEAKAAGEMADTPILKGIREQDRVSTRAEKNIEPGEADPHTVATSNVSLEASKRAKEAWDKNAMLLRDGDFPDLPVKGMRNPDNIVEKTIQHMVDNLLFLHDGMRDRYGPETVARAARWYDGAHEIALKIAAETGYTPRQIAALMANLSPQKDWYQNADLGKRLVDVIKNRQEHSWSPEMEAWSRSYQAQIEAENVKGLTKAGFTPETAAAALQEAVQNGTKPPKAVASYFGKQKSADSLEMTLSSLRRGRPLREINDPDAQAVFARAYDEAHNSKDYPIVTPEGGFAEASTNADGSPSKIGWGSFGEIRKALQALHTDDLRTLSKSLGGNHKVRSFFNNIISPMSEHGDTTIDTHAINATHLRPMGGSHPVVDFGLGTGGSSSIVTGSKGGYAIHHEAYRRAAEKLGLLPRQVQSIAWEAVRGLFSPEQKRDEAFVARNAAIWQDFREGRITAQQARAQILEHSGGIDPPTWYVSPAKKGTEVTIADDGTITAGGNPIGKVKVEHGETQTRIASIEIFPSAQRKGFGSEVIRQIQDEAAARGNPVVLTSDAARGRVAREDQRRLYERLGFVPNRGKDAVGEQIGKKFVKEELVWRKQETPK